MRFRGHLELPHDPDSRLPVDLRVADHALSLSAGDEALGSWSVKDVRLKSLGDGRFDLKLGGERLVFSAEDAASFAHTGVPAITGKPESDDQSMLDKLRSKFTPKPEPEEAVNASSDGPTWRTVTTAEYAPNSVDVAGEATPDAPSWSTATAVQDLPATQVVVPDREDPEPEPWEAPAENDRPRPQTDPVADIPPPAPQDATPDPVIADPVPPPTVTPTTAAELPAPLAPVLDQLAALAGDIRDGHVDPARATAIADVITAMCRVVELGGAAPDQLREITVMLDTRRQGLGPDREGPP